MEHLRSSSEVAVVEHGRNYINLGMSVSEVRNSRRRSRNAQIFNVQPLFHFHQSIIPRSAAQIFRVFNHFRLMLRFPRRFCRFVNIGFLNQKVNRALIECDNIVRRDDSDFSLVFRVLASVLGIYVVKNIDEHPVFFVVCNRLCHVCKTFHQIIGLRIVIVIFVRSVRVDYAFSATVRKAERDVLDVPAERRKRVELYAVNCDECVKVREFFSSTSVF